ncbi:MAG: VWA domain-containing protein [Longimicrobiales bacterium]
MPDAAFLESLHFLRPMWLWALLPVALTTFLLWRRADPVHKWRGVVAPHLLPHLTVGSGERYHLGPVVLLGIGLAFAVLGLAGPTWERERSPFAEDTAPLVVALDLSQTMDAVDVRPSRLERAKQKIQDLLVLRSGAKTALIVYSGSAHSVVPLAEDQSVFEAFLHGLSTAIMPVAGQDPSQALALAEDILARDSVPGSILFLTDGIPEEHVDVFADHRARSEDEVMVLALGTEEGGPIALGDNRFATDAQGRRIVARLDRAGLDALAEDVGIFVGSVTSDTDDVNRVQRRIQTHLEVAQQQDESSRWKDMGYWLVFPMLGITLFWFRRGWTIRWALTVLVVLQAGCGRESQTPNRFADLWLTADQQGRFHYERGNFVEAGGRFADPIWRGVASYRAGDMQNAILSFAGSETPEAYYNIGNSYASIGDLAAAVISYETALALRPDWSEAQDNLDLVRSLIPPPGEAEEDDAGPPPAAPELDPDDVTFDPELRLGEPGAATEEILSDEAIAEMWLRRLQASPADFLRRRFEAEWQIRRSGGVA